MEYHRTYGPPRKMLRGGESEDAGALFQKAIGSVVVGREGSSGSAGGVCPLLPVAPGSPPSVPVGSVGVDGVVGLGSVPPGLVVVGSLGSGGVQTLVGHW